MILDARSEVIFRTPYDYDALMIGTNVNVHTCRTATAYVTTISESPTLPPPLCPPQTITHNLLTLASEQASE